MANVFVEENSLQDIADAIREKNGKETAYKPSEMGAAIRGIEVGSGGKDYLQYVNNVYFTPTFFDDNGEESLTFTFLYATSLFRFFQGVQNSTVKYITINAKQQITDIQQLLYGGLDTTLERLTINFDTSKVKNVAYFIQNKRALRVIDGLPLDFSSATSLNYMFSNLQALEEIRFVPNSLHANFDLVHSSLLSDESIQSIVDGLADLTGTTSQKITFHTNVVSKLTTEQMDAIWAKNWDVA